MALEFKRKEAKTITFTVKDQNKSLVDLSNASFTFVVKDSGGNEEISKTSNFYGDLSSGEVKIDLSSSDLDIQGAFSAELRVEESIYNIDKSKTFDFYVGAALTD